MEEMPGDHLAKGYQQVYEHSDFDQRLGEAPTKLIALPVTGQLNQRREEALDAQPGKL